jgi:hypothetical protein
VIAAAYVLLTKSRASDELPSVDRIAAALPADASDSPEWREHPWTEFPVSDQPLSRRGRAVRMGALIVELEALAAGGDSTAARVAGQVSKLADEDSSARTVGSAYRALADVEAVADRAKRAEAARVAELIAGSTDDVRLGAWLEAARIAAARSDTAFFSAHDTWLALWFARGAAGEDANTRASVSVLSAFVAEPRRDSRRIFVALDALLRALAN